MILVDTSVWVDHLRSGNDRLDALLRTGSVLGHQWVTGEIALGNVKNRSEILALLGGIPQATLAQPVEIVGLIERETLHGNGIGYVDCQLLASTLLTPNAALWTHDKRLRAVASRLGIQATLPERTSP